MNGTRASGSFRKTTARSRAARRMTLQELIDIGSARGWVTEDELRSYFAHGATTPPVPAMREAVRKLRASGAAAALQAAA
ncbi:MAG TPA: hypothetical protein VFX49_08775 [Chloroflexota bacterium]|nr:hypothetical protein [Chloroflexota bacterium]